MMIRLRRIAKRVASAVKSFGVAGALRIIGWRVLVRPWLRLGAASARRAMRAFAEAGRGERLMIIQATVDLAYPYRQRVQHLAMALSAPESGWRVIYHTPATGHDAVLSAKSLSARLLLTPHRPDIGLLRRQDAVMLLSTDAHIDATALAAISAQGATIIYDYIDFIDDSLNNSPFPPARIALHQAMLRDETGVFVSVSADALRDDVLGYRARNWALITNGVDPQPFLAARRADIGLRPDFAAILAKKKPILGYYGVLAAWVDLDLVKALGAARPDCVIVLIGPDLDGSARLLADAPANVHHLPAMPYADLPAHAIWFDVALIPFRLNEITLATSPLKLFEYFALGLPVLSTALPECRKYRSVLIGETGADFIAQVDPALIMRSNADFAAVAHEEAQSNGWNSKVAALNAALDAMKT